MTWRQVLCAVVVLTTISSLAQEINLNDDMCDQAFSSGPLPNDDLMNALYIADTNLATGYMKFNLAVSDVTSGQIVQNTLSYTSWLSQKHNSRKEMANLWSYLGRLVTTNVLELYSHFKLVPSYSGNPYPKVIDFKALYTYFNTACNNYEDQHPWTLCFSSSALCAVRDVLSYVKRIVQGITTTLFPMSDIISRSQYGTDSEDRHSALQVLYSTHLLDYIPEEMRDDLFYESPVVTRSLDHLLHKSDLPKWVNAWSTSSINTVRIQMILNCQTPTYPYEKASDHYYCLGKNFLAKIDTCSTLTSPIDCLYDPLIQEYFTRSRFHGLFEMKLLISTISKTEDVVKLANTVILGNDNTARINFRDKYNSYVTVDTSTCTTNWMRRFDCRDNFGCSRNVENQYKFDCDEGNTCRKQTMYRFDCMMKFILNNINRMITSPTSTVARQDAMVWMSLIPMVDYYPPNEQSEISTVIYEVQNRLKDPLKNYNLEQIHTSMINMPQETFLPSYIVSEVCEGSTIEVQLRYLAFCAFESLFEIVYMSLKRFSPKVASAAVVVMDKDYTVYLQQLSLIHVTTFIDTQMTEYFSHSSQSSQTNFAALSSYFQHLANFDADKITLDMNYLDGMLTKYELQIQEKIVPVSQRFSTVFNYALGGAIGEIVQKAIYLGLAIAGACHPAKALLGGGSIIDVFEAMDELAQAGENLARILKLSSEFENLIILAKTISNGFAQNSEALKDARKLINNLNENVNQEEIMDGIEIFLIWYNDYSIAIDRSEIVYFEAKFILVSENICDAAFAGETTSSAIVGTIIHTKGDCNELTPEIQSLMSIYFEIFDFQNELVDTLADASRAYLAKFKAQEMSNNYAFATNSVNLMSRIALKTFLVSSMHLSTAVEEYCNFLTYQKGGNVPSQCPIAIKQPTLLHVTEVLGITKPQICSSNNEYPMTREISITHSTNSGLKDYIDLEKLYSGESVIFEIPNKQWLESNGWIPPNETKAMYIKQFALYITPISHTNLTQIEISVRNSAKNELVKDDQVYLIPDTLYESLFRLSYEENTRHCNGQEIKHEFDCGQLNDTCLFNDGSNVQTIRPSIFTKWNITATFIPNNPPVPRPTTPFKLVAKITMCKVDITNVGKRDVINQNPDSKARELSRRTVPGTSCCSSNYQYLNANVCQACPPGSVAKWGGLYCE